MRRDAGTPDGKTRRHEQRFAGDGPDWVRSSEGQINAAITEIQTQLGHRSPKAATDGTAPSKRTMSVAARRRIAAAQRKRTSNAPAYARLSCFDHIGIRVSCRNARSLTGREHWR